MTDERGSSNEGSTIAPHVPGRAPRATTSNAPRTAQDLVDELVGLYREQIRRALSVELDDTKTALAFVDHHLSTAANESRKPILSLLAASAGAYYGELVRKNLGGVWIGDGKDPRRLRMLMRYQFIYFAPLDQALEAIAGQSLDLDDERLAGIEHFDPAFRLRPLPEPPETADENHDTAWLAERLAELPQLPEDQFVTLTCRFETLELMHEMLATKHASEGKRPTPLDVADYASVLAAEAQVR